MPCQSLTAPKNGTIACSETDGVLSLGDSCTFTCDSGYELMGSDTVTCQSNGSWDVSGPTCNRGE